MSNISQIHQITNTQNGHKAYVDLIHSPAASRIARQPHLLTLSKKLLEFLEPTAPSLSIEYDFGHVIGNTDIVETSEKDVIIYAKQIRQTTFTRFVKRREMAPSSLLTLLLRQDENGDYELRDVWIGHHAPPPPGTEQENSQSKTYWTNHAVVFEGQALQMRTLTKVAPY